MERKPIIGIMGPGNPKDSGLLKHAEKIGHSVAKNDWILLTGGRPAGVMEAASKGAALAGGLTLGILPDNHSGTASEYVLIPVVTGMGHARNVINILTSNIIVICGMGAGTLSEAALAVKNNKHLLSTRLSKKESEFLNTISDKAVPNYDKVEHLIDQIKKTLKNTK